MALALAATLSASAYVGMHSLAPAGRTPVVSMGLESELGATGPLLPYWDPLGLVSIFTANLTALTCACLPV